MNVWEITDEGVFGRWGQHVPHDLERLYLSRDKAEEVAYTIAKKAHADNIRCHLEYFETPDVRNEFSELEMRWWRDRPQLVVHRSDEGTFFGCGNPEWDERDRRGARYGFVTQRNVVE